MREPSLRLCARFQSSCSQLHCTSASTASARYDESINRVFNFGANIVHHPALFVRHVLLAACLSVVTAGGFASAQGSDYRPVVGEYHPEITLPSIADGEPVSLSDYRGKKVLLIHFASW